MTMVRRLPQGRQPLNTALAQTGLAVLARQCRIERGLIRKGLFQAPTVHFTTGARGNRTAVGLLAQWATVWLLRHRRTTA